MAESSDKGSYYEQAALLDTEEENDRLGDPSEKPASPNTASHSYSKLQQHLDSSAESASDSSDDDSEGLCWGTH